MGITRILLSLGVVGAAAILAGCGCCLWSSEDLVVEVPPGYAYATDYLVSLPVESSSAVAPNVTPPDPETVDPAMDHVIPNDVPPASTRN